MAASGRPRRRLYPIRRDHLRALWEERLRAAAEAEASIAIWDPERRMLVDVEDRTILPAPAEWSPGE